MKNVLYLYMPEGAVGDFITCLPVLDGIYKSLGVKSVLALSDKLATFNGFYELIKMQPMIEAVVQSSAMPEHDIMHFIKFDNWDRRVGKDPKHPHRPIDVTRYEQCLVKYGIPFEVNDDFELFVPELNMPVSDKILVGDRSLHAVDTRRAHHVISSSGKCASDKFKFLDYNQTFIENVYTIKHSPYPLVTTFTGIAGIADMMKKDTIVLWPEELRDWAGQSIEHSYTKHFYTDRNSKLVHIDDFNPQQIGEHK